MINAYCKNRKIHVHLPVFVSVIALGILYYQTHKLYFTMYGLSGLTQVIAVSYALTRFEWGKRSILIILIAAALVMMAQGYVISRGRTRSS